MKTQKAFATLLFGIASITLVNASTVSFTNQDLGGLQDTIVYSAAGFPANSGVAQAGYFNMGFNVSNAIMTGAFSSIFTNFNVLGSDTIGVSGGAGVAGFFYNSVNYLAAGSMGGPPLNAPLFLLIGMGGGSLTNLSGATSLAVLATTQQANIDTPLLDTNNIILGGPNNTTSLSIPGPNGGPLLGTFTSGTLTANPTLVLTSIVAVPEPSALLLSAFGALGLLRRKR